MSEDRAGVGLPALVGSGDGAGGGRELVPRSAPRQAAATRHTVCPAASSGRGSRGGSETIRFRKYYALVQIRLGELGGVLLLPRIYAAARRSGPGPALSHAADAVCGAQWREGEAEDGAAPPGRDRRRAPRTRYRLRHSASGPSSHDGWDSPHLRRPAGRRARAAARRYRRHLQNVPGGCPLGAGQGDHPARLRRRLPPLGTRRAQCRGSG